MFVHDYTISGKTWKWIHFIAIFVFTALWIAATFFGWISLVEFVSHISMLALVYAAISSWQSARVEQKQDDLTDS